MPKNSNFCRKKFPGLKKQILCTNWMNPKVFPNDFADYNPQSCIKNVQEFFCQAGKSFFCRNLKKTEFHFWANVMLRQPQVWASRAFPAQKNRYLRVVLFQKLFKGYIFCFLGHTIGWYIFELFVCETNLKKKYTVPL